MLRFIARSDTTVVLYEKINGYLNEKHKKCHVIIQVLQHYVLKQNFQSLMNIHDFTLLEL